MMISQGPHFIDDTLTFTVTTHRFDTGALTDADAVPAYRVYEDETGTAILTGNMAKLDDAGTTGFYSEQLTLSAANGFEAGKSYNVYVTAAVNSVTGGQSGAFKVSGNLPAAVNTIANNAITAASIATGAIDADAIAADAVTEIQLGLATSTAVDDLPTNAELATALGTADDAVLTAIAALNDISVSDILTAALADAYAANGVAPTLQQAIMGVHQYLMEKAITGTDYTVKKLDGNDAFVVTLNHATTPTASSRD
jgi:hypothetical protein